MYDHLRKVNNNSQLTCLINLLTNIKKYLKIMYILLYMSEI